MSPVGKSQQSTPTLTPSPYAVVYGPQPRPMNGSSLGQGQQGQGQGQMKMKSSKKSAGGGGSRSGGSTPSDNNQLVEVPAQLFYPFYPESQVSAMQPPAQNGAPGNVNTGSSGSSGSGAGAGHQRDYSGLLAAAVATQDNTYGYQASQDSFVSEERDPKLSIQQQQGMQMWVNAVS